MIFKNLTANQLVEKSISLGESVLSPHGALMVTTGQFTGRASKDKYIVKDAFTEQLVHWGPINQPLDRSCFEKLKDKVCFALAKKQSFIQELGVGADSNYHLNLTVHTELAYQARFAQIMFRDKGNPTLGHFSIYCAPSAFADPSVDGTRGSTFVAIDFTSREVVIGGTQYAGEIKKSVFTILNTLLPAKGVLPMHAGVNCHPETKQSAIFFGLSGTGKTSLSTDGHRPLVGDDEHGWGDTGVFNFEGGCYAKAIKLSPKNEKEIWQASHTFGAILENVVWDPNTGIPDFNDGRLTENTRASYDLHRIELLEPSGKADHPQAIIMLTCDAFGVLPPLAKLTADQAMYYFLSGYTAKVAGTEMGVKEPTATFSACFGEAFMTLPPLKYALLLGEKIKKQNTPCYLVNTGWHKGPYGVGRRMELAFSRDLVGFILSGEAEKAVWLKQPHFHFHIPEKLGSYTEEQLDISRSWPSQEAYAQQTLKLVALFEKNFEHHLKKGSIPPSVLQAGPHRDPAPSLPLRK